MFSSLLFLVPRGPPHPGGLGARSHAGWGFGPPAGPPPARSALRGGVQGDATHGGFPVAPADVPFRVWQRQGRPGKPRGTPATRVSRPRPHWAPDTTGGSQAPGKERAGRGWPPVFSSQPLHALPEMTGRSSHSREESGPPSPHLWVEHRWAGVYVTPCPEHVLWGGEAWALRGQRGSGVCVQGRRAGRTRNDQTRTVMSLSSQSSGRRPVEGRSTVSSLT